MSIEIKEIKKLNPSQLSQCIEISNRLFGKGYHSRKYFLKEEIVTIVAIKNNNIIGFFIGKKEIKNVYSEDSIKKPFNLSEILKQDFIIDKVQPIYFFIDSFEQLLDSLAEIRKLINSKS